MTAAERIVAVVPTAADAEQAAQTHPLDDVIVGPRGLHRAHGSGARWIWVLSHGGTPRADTLERLLRARSPTSSVVAGAIHDAAGRIVETALPGFATTHPDVIELAGRGLLPIRHADFAHCLIDATALTRHGFPNDARFGLYAPVEWTARVLRASNGYFDPASIVTAETRMTDARPGLNGAAQLARMLRTDAWSRGDRLAALTRALARP